MPNLLSSLFSTVGLIPHGYCINWTPALLWTYIVSDALIVLAYFSIPFALAYFVWRRRDLKFRRLFLMLGAFILACGIGHLLSIILLWYPVYWLDAAIKATTAAISIATAISLIWVIPKALRLPNPAQMEAEIQTRRIAQEQLRDSESRLQTSNMQLTALIEAIPDAIFLKDGEGRWLVTNEPAKQLFHLHALDWQGKTDMQLALMQPERRAEHETCFTGDEMAWSAGRLISVNETVIDESHGIRELEVRKVPFFREDGQRKGLVVIGRDITDRRRAEQNLRIADTAIESQDGVIITDASNYILRVNRSFTRLTGYEPEEVIGKTPAILKSGRHDREFYRAMWETLVHEKFWQGEVWDRRKNGEIYPKWLTITAVTGAGGEITNYVGAFTDLSEHKEAEEAIHRLAFYDPLTDLPNRRLLRDRLQLALTSSTRNRHYGAVLMVDLDNFKSVNDSRGHEVGDQLLVEVARRLTACVRQGDTVSRLGGDEFIVMLEDLSVEEAQAAAQAEGVGEKILEAINQPYHCMGVELNSSPSIGICLFNDYTQKTDEIFKRADAAMYQAKNCGRNTMRFYDPDMQASLEARISLEADLRHALQNQQLRLHYQVQVDHTNRVFGAEILLRWEHPQHGLISPADFIPIAEESGLIVPIGAWVLQCACEQIKTWEKNPATRSLQLAVNVSARQFRQPDFVGQLLDILVRTDINTRMLKLELTESVVLHNITDTIEKMQALKRFGVQFSMDDFGTGYSSLSYLKKLPLDQLKIDQSFVRDIVTDQNDAVIAHTIIGMARNLGLDVIAEGVETEAQRDCLLSRGCAAFQGYLYGKPMPLEAFEAFIEAHSDKGRA